MNATRKVKLRDIIPNLTCCLCKGYLVDATTIIECLHSFCKSCIVAHLEKTEYCPVCDVQLHISKPLSSLRSDQMLQEVVYKLVPGLFQNEMRRRREFYKGKVDSVPTSQEDSGHMFNESYISSDDLIHLSLDHQLADGTVRENSRRYIMCPAAVSISILKRFILAKFELKDEILIDFMYGDRIMPDDFLLMDIAYKYSWNQNGKPLQLSYRMKGLPSESDASAVGVNEVKPAVIKRRKSRTSMNATLPIEESERSGPAPNVKPPVKKIKNKKKLINGKTKDENSKVEESVSEMTIEVLKIPCVEGFGDEPKPEVVKTLPNGMEITEVREVQLRISENGIICARNVISGEERIIDCMKSPRSNGLSPTRYLPNQVITVPSQTFTQIRNSSSINHATSNNVNHVTADGGMKRQVNGDQRQNESTTKIKLPKGTKITPLKRKIQSPEVKSKNEPELKRAKLTNDKKFINSDGDKCANVKKAMCDLEKMRLKDKFMKNNLPTMVNSYHHSTPQLNGSLRPSLSQTPLMLPVHSTTNLNGNFKKILNGDTVSNSRPYKFTTTKIVNGDLKFTPSSSSGNASNSSPPNVNGFDSPPKPKKFFKYRQSKMGSESPEKRPALDQQPPKSDGANGTPSMPSSPVSSSNTPTSSNNNVNANNVLVNGGTPRYTTDQMNPFSVLNAMTYASLVPNNIPAFAFTPNSLGSLSSYLHPRSPYNYNFSPLQYPSFAYSPTLQTFSSPLQTSASKAFNGSISSSCSTPTFSNYNGHSPKKNEVKNVRESSLDLSVGKSKISSQIDSHQANSSGRIVNGFGKGNSQDSSKFQPKPLAVRPNFYAEIKPKPANSPDKANASVVPSSTSSIAEQKADMTVRSPSSLSDSNSGDLIIASPIPSPAPDSPSIEAPVKSDDQVCANNNNNNKQVNINALGNNIQSPNTSSSSSALFANGDGSKHNSPAKQDNDMDSNDQIKVIVDTNTCNKSNSDFISTMDQIAIPASASVLEPTILTENPVMNTPTTPNPVPILAGSSSTPSS